MARSGLKEPPNFSKGFARKADLLKFGKTRFHDLRGIHSTALLDAGIPVHTVARRIGDDPAVLLRNYAKRKRSKQVDQNVASAIAAFSLPDFSGHDTNAGAERCAQKRALPNFVLGCS